MSWIIASIVILGLLVLGLLIFLFFRPKSMKMETDYRAFFIIGVIWLTFGLIGMAFFDWDWFFLIMGAVFSVLGLANYKKWKKQKKWSELTPEEQRFKMILIGFLAVTLIAAGLAWLLLMP